ncbi:MAG: sulfur reduction protein DsrE [Proteobacteria bacterium]|nr:sulfur reduction protein DsrE [Pseudomonadota bacterium]MBU1451871.1 sulfur reduction protein DsrE [Pseudomonadota bacterium]MBU2468485.1 sulfur reduction protein DsrE [Pseudomonadota bacterium]
MQILIVLSSPDPEIKWNTVRLGNFLLNQDEEVTIFLNGAATDLYRGDSESFPIAEQAKLFALSEGLLAA